MKTRLYLISFMLFLAARLFAQDCSSVQFTCSSTESRCSSTGSITVNVTGGSGNFNYKVTGPVTTPFTNSEIITGLSAGYYKVTVKDVINNCTKEKDSVFVPGTYSDPRFQLVKTDVSCQANDGTISIQSQNFGRSPFNYTIISPSPSKVGTTSALGSFSGLIAGEYYIQLTDSCGGIQVRRITVENYFWWFDAVNIVKAGCDSATATIRLKDNKGNIDTAGTAFSGFSYGVVLSPGDTAWHSSHTFTFYIGTKHTATIVVKDPCGNTHVYNWTMPPGQLPSASGVNLGNFTCTDFSASVAGLQNLTNPTFCIYDNNSSLLTCNTIGNFTNLAYGQYCIKVYNGCSDTTISFCFNSTKPVAAINSTVAISNKSCTTFTATITGQQNLFSPTYCLYDSLNNQLSCNSTGAFYGLAYGRYCIKVTSGCNDTTITTCFNTQKPVPAVTGFTIGNKTCNSFSVQLNGTNLFNPTYCIYDSTGTLITCDPSGNFTGLGYGSYCVKAVTACGDTTAPLCFSSIPPVPSVSNNVTISNLLCSGFTATITGQNNLTLPYYCLYDNLGTLVSCDSTGIFTNIPYGSYCIKIKDGCFDTTITRCFSKARSIPSISATMQQLNSSCTKFTAKVTGNNLTSPQYCIYDVSNTQLSCNTTGIFDSLPYGHYCVQVKDGCVDTTMTVCQDFALPRKMTVTTSKACTIGFANMDIQFQSSTAPYTIDVYKPGGTLLLDTVLNTNPAHLLLPALGSGAQYKLIGRDACGAADTVSIVPDATLVVHNATVVPKCPTGTFTNGSGDLMINSSSNFNNLVPTLIKKNGVAFSKGYSAQSGSTYTISDLEPATYIIEYVLQGCNVKVYDTVLIPQYAFPSQGQSALYQCDNNGFSLGANVKGGVAPFNYQIIGSSPDSPSIITSKQDSSVFNINTGTTYSLVRLRTIDGCGNATLSDVSVLPLQNFSVSASSNCFYQNINLAVDQIPNASYNWYRKTTPTDSTLLASSSSYNLPFFVPEQVGEYICTINVNGGCLNRQVSFNLDGNCGAVVLANTFTLKGKASAVANNLNWSVTNERDASQYVVERKAQGDRFATLSTVNASNSGIYFYTDDQPVKGANVYRLKAISKTGKITYSNSVTLVHENSHILVYPNPVKEAIHISLHNDKAADYRVELIFSSGQTIYKQEIKNIKDEIITLNRTARMPSGIYLVKVTNLSSGEVNNFKIIFP